MLVLTRKRDEKVYIGDDIVITVLECEPGKIKLGFSVPKEIRVDRAEVRERQQAADIRGEG